MLSTAIVSAENLSHQYGDRKALDSLSFSVAPREIYGVLGPNGGGKSTLFRILCTLLRPSSGSAALAGFSVLGSPGKVRKRIGVVFQANSLDTRLRVIDNLEVQALLHSLPGRRAAARIDEVLSRLGLRERSLDVVSTLSGGMQRRVEIAKALLHSPEILLLDEPSTGLDPGARRELWQYLEELREAGATILLTTHLLDEADRCDRILLLHQGRKVAEGKPAELKQRVRGDVVVLGANGLEQQIESRFGVKAITVDKTIHIEIRDGHKFVPAVMEAFPGEIEFIALHKPTLEDVFIAETGSAVEGLR